MIKKEEITVKIESVGLIYHDYEKINDDDNNDKTMILLQTFLETKEKNDKIKYLNVLPLTIYL